MARRTVLLAMLVLPLSGCAVNLLGGDKGPPPTTYDLVAQVPAGGLGSSGAVLAVREPQALQVLDAQGIVYRPTPLQITYFAGAQWADRLPRLVEARLLEAFQRGGRLRTVTRSTDGLTTDYQVASELRRFGVEETPTGKVARVSIFVQLINDASGRPAAGRLFETSTAVAGDDAAAAVAGFDQALSAALTEIVRWTLARI